MKDSGLRFLDCGCCITLATGERTWCPTCASGYNEGDPPAPASEVGNIYRDANRSGYARWDLLLDYDRARDVPGMVTEEPKWYALPNGRGIHAALVADGEPNPDRLRAILEKRLARAGYGIVAFDFRKSTNGWHAKVRLNPHPAPIESVALQSICGSDPSRESCNVQRAREVERWAREVEEGGSDMAHEAIEFWYSRWNVLYQPNPQRQRKP